MGVRESVGTQRVAADELRESARYVDGCSPGRSHLVQMDRNTALGDLPGGFRPRQPTPYDRDFLHNRKK
jgi:hypothetical protein